MLLAIDIGNTRIKCAVFKEDTLLEVIMIPSPSIRKEIENILSLHPAITDFIVASVGSITQNDFDWVAKSIKIHFIKHQSEFPFTNLYKTPNTLGIDRMILASGAALKFPTQNKLIIDAGTAITYDFVDAQNNYHGGAISPGITLRYRALNNHTAKLPLLDNPEKVFFVGQTTSESIHSGVVNGILYEIEGFITEFKNKQDNFIIILTGGDSVFLAKRLKSTIFANRNFLLESLKDLYQYQNQ